MLIHRWRLFSILIHHEFSLFQVARRYCYQKTRERLNFLDTCHFLARLYFRVLYVPSWFSLPHQRNRSITRAQQTTLSVSRAAWRWNEQVQPDICICLQEDEEENKTIMTTAALMIRLNRQSIKRSLSIASSSSNAREKDQSNSLVWLLVGVHEDVILHAGSMIRGVWA